MKLLQPTTFGGHTLANSMVMAPMTRSRATVDGVVGPMTVEYYTQRAGAGLIVTEGINISPDAIGSPYTPGLFKAEQVEAWRSVTTAVHEHGGVIFAQLWHAGRVGHSIDRNGQLPVAPSPIPITGQQHFTSQGMQPYETPRALTTAEVQSTIEDYRTAAANAIRAGFDGVELHGAFGYLPNEFLAASANTRTDQYGGSIENRVRFTLEAIDAMVESAGADRTAIKLSPASPYNSIDDPDPIALYQHLIGELNHRQLSYVHLMQPMMPLNDFPHFPNDVLAAFAPSIQAPVIANAGFTRDTAEAVLQSGQAQLVSFGALYLANPDLHRRFAIDGPLNEPDRVTFFGGAAGGYIDYPALDE